MDTSHFRIIDANRNRAVEALRVIEEYCRFVRNDAESSALLKQLRHDLHDAIALLPADRLLAARDTPGDVGTHVSTDQEAVRPDSISVVAASCSRLTQALRAIEEYGKIVNDQIGPRVEQIRYRSYELERRLLAGVRRLRQRFEDSRLYLLVGTDVCSGDVIEAAAQAIDGGVDVVQLREKHADGGALLDLADRVRTLTSRRDVLFIVNDRCDIAAMSDADGVHLGQNDVPVNRARSVVGREKLIGASTHNRDELAAAITSGVDYVAVGSVFGSTTKPGVESGGLDYVTYALRELEQVGLAHVAIGGINSSNIRLVAQAGVRRVAVCGAILQADDPTAVARQLRSVLDGG